MTTRALLVFTASTLTAATLGGCALEPGGDPDAGALPDAELAASDLGEGGAAWEVDAGGHRPMLGVPPWSEWTCETVGDTYCYANFNDDYCIKCYPNTPYDCLLGSDRLGEYTSCPRNAATGCGSCREAFDACGAAWIAAGN